LPAQLHQWLGPELRILGVVHFSAGTGEQQAARMAEHVRNPHVDAVLVDSRTEMAVGGTGVTFDWVEARKALFQNAEAQSDEVKKRRIAAGGLNPDNVADAIATLHPWGVDVVSGVEAAPGHKDKAKVREFVARARSVDREME